MFNLHTIQLKINLAIVTNKTCAKNSKTKQKYPNNENKPQPRHTMYLRAKKKKKKSIL